MIIRFTSDVFDHDTNVTFGYDLDFTLEVEARMVNGEPIVSVTEVWLDDVELISSKSPLSCRIGCEIADEAASTEWVISEALEDAGYGWSGKGANDPDGHFVRAFG